MLNDTDFYKNWKSPPLPIYSKYYLFNITNHVAVLRGAMPILQEVGPFVFRRKISRQILGYNDDHEELSFITTNSYIYVPEKSNGETFDSVIYTLNIPLAVSISDSFFFLKFHNTIILAITYLLRSLMS